MPRTPRTCSSRGSGSTRMTPRRRPTRPAWTAGPSTGRRCGASTRPTATGTWSARARRRRRSLTDPEAFGSLAGDGEGVQFGEVRRQAHGDHALLLLGVGAGDHGYRHDVAAVHREMRDARWYVHEVAGVDHGAL